jgi:hypothetical protein
MYVLPMLSTSSKPFDDPASSPAELPAASSLGGDSVAAPAASPVPTGATEIFAMESNRSDASKEKSADATIEARPTSVGTQHPLPAALVRRRNGEDWLGDAL